MHCRPAWSFNAVSRFQWKLVLLNPRRQLMSCLSSEPVCDPKKQGHSQIIYYTVPYEDKRPGVHMCWTWTVFFCIIFILIIQYVKGYFYSYTFVNDCKYCKYNPDIKKVQYKMLLVCDIVCVRWYTGLITSDSGGEFLPQCFGICCQSGDKIKFTSYTLQSFQHQTLRHKKKGTVYVDAVPSKIYVSRSFHSTGVPLPVGTKSYATIMSVNDKVDHIVF